MMTMDPNTHSPSHGRMTRREALDIAASAYMEVAVDERLGQSPTMSIEAYEHLEAAVDGWTVNEAERADLMEQARMLAAGFIDARWDELEPSMLAQGGLVVSFTDLRSDELSGERLAPLGDLTAGTTDVYQVLLRHITAHAIVAAVVAGVHVSHGFAGVRMESAPSPSDELTILLAGRIADGSAAGGPVAKDCRCWQDAVERTIGAHGTAPEAGHGALRASPWAVATDIVGRALASGYLDREAGRLHDHGRILIDPTEAEAAIAANDEAKDA